MLKAPTMSRASPSLRWLHLKQGIWMHPTKIPRGDCSLLQFAHADLSYGINYSRQSPPVLSILCRDSISLAWSSWSLGSTQTRIPVGFDLLNAKFLSSSIFSLPLFLFFCRTGLKRSPSASLFQTWTSCEQLLPPSARCFGNSWKMFTLVALAALSRKESG